MRKTMTILLMLARLLFVVQIVVGLCLWFGVLTQAVASHAALGSLFVLVAWIIAIIALFALSRRAVALITLLVGAIVLWFGMAQTSFLPGGMHWAVRVVHLLLGIATMGLVESLGKAVKIHLAATTAALKE
jgi:hypothetical protein